jgi:periplasmic protein CpxP/Spy
MKFNPLVILAGGCVAGLLTITPFIAQANSAGSLAQSAPAASADRPLQQAFDRLNLTPAQQTQFSSLRRDTRTQMQSILSAAQRQQFLTSWQQGSSFRDSVAAMNLTDGQRQQMRELFQSTRAQARTLLTDSQRQELRELIQNRLDQAL